MTATPSPTKRPSNLTALGLTVAVGLALGVLTAYAQGFLPDELAALAVSQPDLVTWEQADLIAGDDGRITADDAGRPVRFAAAADREATEAALLEALRRGGPRATPFQLAGTIDITWDGTTCAATIITASGITGLTFAGMIELPG